MRFSRPGDRLASGSSQGKGENIIDEPWKLVVSGASKIRRVLPVALEGNAFADSGRTPELPSLSVEPQSCFGTNQQTFRRGCGGRENPVIERALRNYGQFILSEPSDGPVTGI